MTEGTSFLVFFFFQRLQGRVEDNAGLPVIPQCQHPASISSSPCNQRVTPAKGASRLTTARPRHTLAQPNNARHKAHHNSLAPILEKTATTARKREKSTAEQRTECFFQRAHLAPGAYSSHHSAWATNQRGSLGCSGVQHASTALLTLHGRAFWKLGMTKGVGGSGAGRTGFFVRRRLGGGCHAAMAALLMRGSNARRPAEDAATSRRRPRSCVEAFASVSASRCGTPAQP